MPQHCAAAATLVAKTRLSDPKSADRRPPTPSSAKCARLFLRPPPVEDRTLQGRRLHLEQERADTVRPALSRRLSGVALCPIAYVSGLHSQRVRQPGRRRSTTAGPLHAQPLPCWRESPRLVPDSRFALRQSASATNPAPACPNGEFVRRRLPDRGEAPFAPGDAPRPPGSNASLADSLRPVPIEACRGSRTRRE